MTSTGFSFLVCKTGDHTPKQGGWITGDNVTRQGSAERMVHSRRSAAGVSPVTCLGSGHRPPHPHPFSLGPSVMTSWPCTRHPTRIFSLPPEEWLCGLPQAISHWDLSLPARSPLSRQEDPPPSRVAPPSGGHAHRRIHPSPPRAGGSHCSQGPMSPSVCACDSAIPICSLAESVGLRTGWAHPRALGSLSQIERTPRRAQEGKLDVSSGSDGSVKSSDAPRAPCLPTQLPP